MYKQQGIMRLYFLFSDKSYGIRKLKDSVIIQHLMGNDSYVKKKKVIYLFLKMKR